MYIYFTCRIQREADVVIVGAFTTVQTRSYSRQSVKALHVVLTVPGTVQRNLQHIRYISLQVQLVRSLHRLDCTRIPCCRYFQTSIYYQCTITGDEELSCRSRYILTDDQSGQTVLTRVLVNCLRIEVECYGIQCTKLCRLICCIECFDVCSLNPSCTFVTLCGIQVNTITTKDYVLQCIVTVLLGHLFPCPVCGTIPVVLQIVFLLRCRSYIEVTVQEEVLSIIVYVHFTCCIQTEADVVVVVGIQTVSSRRQVTEALCGLPVSV